MMNRSEQINELATALAKAQGQMRPAAKTAENPHFRARYADLASVIDAVREPLSSNGLSYTQCVGHADGSVIVETVLMHASGQWISSELALRPAKADVQGVGSAVTYGRRYSLQAICGLASDFEDDDGNAAVGHGRPQPVATARAVEKAPSVDGFTAAWQAKIDSAGSIDALTGVGKEWRGSGIAKDSKADQDFMTAWMEKRSVLS
jgi:hypothetical protein